MTRRRSWIIASLYSSSGGESMTETKRCLWCETEFSPYIGRKRKFCGHICMANYKRKVRAVMNEVPSIPMDFPTNEKEDI